MNIRKLSKLETTTNLYNQILQELTVAEAKLKIATREEILDTTMNPEMTKQVAEMRIQFTALQENIKIVEDMLSNEEKQVRETEKN